MKKTVYKWFWVWEFEKEERWLNEMAMSGWALVQIGYAKYVFEKSEPGAYIIRLEMHDAEPMYLSFMEEAGAEYLGRITKWIYFRRKAELGTFDLFSDVDSRIAHLDRVGKLLTALVAANLCVGIINSVSEAHVGWLNLLVASFLTYGLGRLHGKKEDLEQERLLHE